jgi:UDP-3-O-[3-hydroxymyristoyl] glucosamine N-acyltransferase
VNFFQLFFGQIGIMEIKLSRIAGVIGGALHGDPQKIIRGTAPFESALGDEITFAGSAKFLKQIGTTRAGAVLVPRDFHTEFTNRIGVDNPQVAFTRVLELFHPRERPEGGVSPMASIGRSFDCGEDVHVGPFVTIGNDVSVGHRTVLHPSVVIGNGVTIGNDVVIYPNVTVAEGCRIGNRVMVHAGTVIGSDGFGFAPDGERYCKIIHTGIVQIDDDVEIGAGNTVDRATYGKTWIQKGVKTDNLVHIAHNVTVGENTLLVAQVGISGSVSIGSHAILAGQAGVAGHLRIGDNAVVGPQAGIARSVSDGKVVSGSPEMPHRTWLRVQRILPTLPKLVKKLSDLEKRIRQMEEGQG